MSTIRRVTIGKNLRNYADERGGEAPYPPQMNTQSSQVGVNQSFSKKEFLNIIKDLKNSEAGVSDER